MELWLCESQWEGEGVPSQRPCRLVLCWASGQHFEGVQIDSLKNADILPGVNVLQMFFQSFEKVA